MTAEIASAALVPNPHPAPAAIAPEVVRYVGRVKAVHDGYGWIDFATVLRANGQPNDLDTTADIFVHQKDCDAAPIEGVTLEFAIADDPRREGCYRAVDVREAFVPVGGPAAPTFRLIVASHGFELARARHTHALMPPVPAATVALARANIPFEEIPADDAEVLIPDDPAALRQYFAQYLWTRYPGLASIGVTCAMDVRDLSAEEALVKSTKATYEGMNMRSQARSLSAEYDHFLPMRGLLQWILDENLLRPGTRFSPVVLFALIKLIQESKTGGARKAIVEKVQAFTRFLLTEGILRPNTILPDRVLPVFLAACPVVFWDDKPTDDHGATIASVDGKGQNHMPSDWFPHIAQGPRKSVLDRLTARPGKALFHLFNTPPARVSTAVSDLRTFQNYAGENPLPQLLERIERARALFDYVGIWTPYVDQVIQEAQRGVDPYIFGFINGLPIFSVLGRYSDAGVLPLIPELVGHTMEFLRKSGGEIRPGGREGDRRVQADVQAILIAFDAGRLFSYLRGEWELPTQGTAVPTSNANAAGAAK